MTTTTKKCSINEALDSLTKIASAYSIIYGCSLINSDMEISIEELKRGNLFESKFYGIVFLAIRHAGVECGTKQHVKTRCQRLGRPVCVVKIEQTTEASEKVVLTINS